MSGPIIANTTYKQVPIHASVAPDPPLAKNFWPHAFPLSHTPDWFDWAFANTSNFKQHRHEYNATVDWIKTNIEDYENNAMWKKVGDAYYIRLKKDADAILFTLKFGKGNEYEF